jgi:hypothetical protein
MNGWCKVWILPLALRWLIPKAYSAVALWPLIVIRDIQFAQPHIINHERIHLKQQIELGVVFFYFVYVFEYLNHRIKGKNHNDAYMNISFEREAYTFECDLKYLENRKFWSQWRTTTDFKH